MVDTLGSSLRLGHRRINSVQFLSVLLVVAIIGLLWLWSIGRSVRLRGWRRTLLVPSVGMYLFYLYFGSAAGGLIGGEYGLRSAVLWVALAVVVIIVAIRPLSLQAEAAERSEAEEFSKLVSRARYLAIDPNSVARIVIEVTHGKASKAGATQELQELIGRVVDKE